RSGYDRERPALADELRALGEVSAQDEVSERRDPLVEVARDGDVGNAEPEVVDDPVLSHRVVVHRLGAVPVRIEQEAAVVIRPVLRPGARLAVGLVTGLGADAPELVDVLAGWCGKADVQAARDGSI